VSEAAVFVAIPSYNGWLHKFCVAGMLETKAAFAGRIAFEISGGCYVQNNRDELTAKFLDTPGATHMLCLDSDIGWSASHLQMLVDSDKDVVSGIYCKKQDDRALPFEWAAEPFGNLREAVYAPGGFLLVKRAVIERMYGAFRELAYTNRAGQPRVGLWQMIGPTGEDIMFCRRWRELSGKVWARTDCILKHFGEQCFVPNPS
jgi:hypothetical protein